MSQAVVIPRTLTPLPVTAPRWRRLAALMQNPISMYTEEHFTLPMVHAPFGGKRFAQIMAPDLVQQVLQGEGEYFGRSVFVQKLLQPALRGGLLTTEGSEWRQQRRAASPSFRQKALDALVPSFSRAGSGTVGRLRTVSGQVSDVHPQMVRATFDVIIDTLLTDGHDQHLDAEQIAADVDAFLATIGRLALPDILPFLERLAPRPVFVPGYRRGMAAIDRLRALAGAIVERRLARPTDTDDLMGQLIRARDPETGAPLTPDQLVDNALTFVGAGHETTALALTWALYILAETKETQTALAEEAFGVLGDRDVTAGDINQLPLHDRVVKEAMRLFPPVPIIGRRVIRPVTIGGVDFNPDDNIAIAIYAMHRHHSLWDQPSAFDPNRFRPEVEAQRHRFAYLPFGGGPRICIGMRFAVMEAVTILSYLTRNFVFDLPANANVVPFLTTTMRPKGGLPLIIRPR